MIKTPQQQQVYRGEPLVDDEIDISQIFGTLWRGKFWIALASMVALCLGIWYAFFSAVPVYTANATVALESREQQVMDIESVVTGLSGDQASINTELEVIRSRVLIERLVNDLDLLDDPEFNSELRGEPRFSLNSLVNLFKTSVLGAEPTPKTRSDRAVLDASINTVLSKIQVSNIRQSYVFRMTVTTEDPEKSAAMANRLAELYIEDQVQVKFEKTEQATTWLSERVSELQIALETAEEELKAFSANTDLVSPEGLVALNRQLKELRERRDALRGEIQTLNTRLASLEVARSSGSRHQFAVLAQDATLTAILEREESQQVTLEEAFDVRSQSILEKISLDIQRSESQISALEASISEVTDRIGRQSEELVELQQLQREAEASRLIYEAFLARLKETSIQQGIQQADSRILSKAVVPTGPSAPRKPLILALSLVLGLVAGSSIVLGREMMQSTFRVAEVLEERTGYAVLGQIPSITARKRSNVLKYLTEKPNSAAAEAIRNLRTSLLLANLDQKPQIIMSTSSIPGEGKTTQSIALAQNFAGLGEKVLLIEGDIRRRVFSEYFSVSSKRGFLSVLSGDAKLEDVVSHDAQLKADVLMGEKSSVNAADLFSSDKFASFLNELRKEYDRIIIDTPPVLAVPDARVIGQSVDAIIYTVKWDSTSQRQVLDGLKSFESVNLRVSGVVLGQIDKRGMKRYGYGDHYGAYQAYYDN